MNNLFRATRNPVPFVPFSSQVGLLEKRVQMYTQLSLVDAVSKLGAYNHYPDSDLFLVDLTSAHNNHASDPGTVTLTLAQNAITHWSRPRALPDVLALTDHAHAYLLGLGGGNPDLSQHTVTFDSTMVSGQPVYVSGNGTVDAALADNVTTSEVVGLVLVGASSGNQGVILTEGSVTKADWTAVTGSASLVPATTYYLSDASAGTLTGTAPVTRGNYVVRVGKALSTTVMDIEIAADLLL